jgi:hypothetical protein
MAKGKNETSPAEDYIDQLQWKAQHHRRWVPVRFEPRWKYKIVYRYPPTTGFEGAIGLVVLVSIIIVVVALLSSDVATIGEKIFFGSVFGLIVLIVFFAIRDVSEDEDKKSDD